MKGLTPKQRRFVTEYLRDQNATQAAIRCGYKKINADVTGPRLLGIVGIRAAVDEKLAKIQDKVIVSREYVLGNLKEVAERCMTHAPVMEFDHEEKQMKQKTAFMLDPETGKGKEVGVYEFDSNGANKSLELLGKSLKLFTDRVEHSVNEDLAKILNEARTNDAGAV